MKFIIPTSNFISSINVSTGHYDSGAAFSQLPGRLPAYPAGAAGHDHGFAVHPGFLTKPPAGYVGVQADGSQECDDTEENQYPDDDQDWYHPV